MIMIIDVLISDKKHPILTHLQDWVIKNKLLENAVSIKYNSNDLIGGDFLFLVSCSEIVSEKIIKKFKYSFILHASDLPEGRGWSPHIWNILEGKNTLTVCLLSPSPNVDRGDIWLKKQISFEGHELFDEINNKLFKAELELMSQILNIVEDLSPSIQKENQSNYYPKRTPEDSRLDLNKTLKEQFNLLRIADKDRYPAFFEYMGHKYFVTIQKDENE
jgi:methionyl-tRNA formyltransferase